MTLATLVLALLLVCASAAAAQPAGAPQVLNGRVEARAGGDLAAATRAVAQGPTDVAWVGYAVPAEGRANRCCWKDSGDAGACCWGCRLEQGGGTAMPLPASGATDRPAPLEPVADRAVVLVRVAAGAIDRIRVYSPSCTLDAGGRTVIWLSTVTADASVTWLHTQAASGSRRLADDAVMALSAHAAPAALGHLIALARSSASTQLRKQAFFWLGQSKDPRALAFFAEILTR